MKLDDALAFYEEELDIDDADLEEVKDQAAVVKELNLIKSSSVQLADVATKRESLLAYRESVDIFMDPEITTKRIEESNKRIKQQKRQLNKNSPSYA